MAYNFIPKTPGDVIKNISDANIAAEICVALNYLLMKFPTIEEPITIDPKSPKKFNVTRKLDGYLNVVEFKKMLNKTTFKFGEGSRGGRGIANKGNLFEQELAKDLLSWRDGETVSTTANMKLIDSLIKEYDIDQWGRFEIDPEGALNKPRPLVISGNSILVSPGLVDIGSTVTDITITSEDKSKKIYLSLKYSGTVTFFNAGTKKYLTDTDLTNGLIKNKDGITLLEAFGINNEMFCSVFNGKGKNFKSFDTTSQVNKQILENLIKSGIGYGFHMVHKLGNEIVSKKVDRQYRDAAAKVQTVKVFYGGKTGTGKRVDIEVLTPKYILKFNFRNKQGGNFISHLMCDYSYRK
jgi:hypothetical protein